MAWSVRTSLASVLCYADVFDRPEEQWSPKSSLLQVMVSIQSMILVELPYFNESVLSPLLTSFFTYRGNGRPGYGNAVKSNVQSIAYNKNIAAQTTRWAIVDWLWDENRNSIWAVSASRLLVETPQSSQISGFTGRHRVALHSASAQDSRKVRIRAFCVCFSSISHWQVNASFFLSGALASENGQNRIHTYTHTLQATRGTAAILTWA